MGKVTRESILKWIPIREKGRKYYILKEIKDLIVGVFIVDALILTFWPDLTVLGIDLPSRRTVLSVVILLTLGYVVSRLQWFFEERSFAAHQHLLEEPAFDK